MQLRGGFSGFRVARAFFAHGAAHLIGAERAGEGGVIIAEILRPRQGGIVAGALQADEPILELLDLCRLLRELAILALIARKFLRLVGFAIRAVVVTFLALFVAGSRFVAPFGFGAGFRRVFFRRE